MSRRATDSGVVLINVLVVLAIAGGLMFLLIATQEAALDRVARASDAAIAEQIALGAEASVVDALRRDLDEAPDLDHLQEAWARGVIQDEVILPTGKFSVQVVDLQAKFDVNQLAGASVVTLEFGRRLMRALDLPPETADQIARILGVTQGVEKLDDLGDFGVSAEALSALAPYVGALPVSGTINLNTVDPFLLAVMLQNRGQAAQLIRLRTGRGYLTLADLNEANVIRPQNSGLVSNAYLVVVQAQAGTARIKMETVVVRTNLRGVKAVDITERRFVYDRPASTDDM